MESEYRELKADPSFVTGLTDDPEAPKLWRDVFAYSGGEASIDTEFLFVAGIMAGIFPYALGDETEWGPRGSRMKNRALNLLPTALPLSTFHNRGEYGDYFAHQLRGQLYIGGILPSAPSRW